MAGKKQIKVAVFFTPANFDEMFLKDKTVVVIDVLRASTSIMMALQNGAKEIIPVSNVESAVKISGSLFGDVTLRAGERNSRIIEGFNLGNSPVEYTEEVVKGKSIIFITTNGSAAIVKGRHAKRLIVAGFVNIAAVVAFLKDAETDFTIVCAGKENNFSLEDAVCAGALINRLKAETDAELILDDGGTAATGLEKSLGGNILKMLKNTEHGKYLTEIGFAQDLKVCAGVDSVNLLPMLSGNVIRVYKEASKRVA